MPNTFAGFVVMVALVVGIFLTLCYFTDPAKIDYGPWRPMECREVGFRAYLSVECRPVQGSI